MTKNILAALAVVVLLCATAYASFFVAPTESTMGAIQRIFYLHAACGMVALTAFFICFIANLFFVFRRAAKWDALGIASAEVGLAFCTVVLLTGPIWAHPVWGVWWAWDARLTLTLVLWLLYLSYAMLRTLIEEPERRALISAVYGIFAFLDVPLVYGSIWWWRTQHPQPVVFGGAGSGLDPVMRRIFYLSWFSLTCLMAFLIRERYRLERLRYEVSDLQREAEAS